MKNLRLKEIQGIITALLNGYSIKPDNFSYKFLRLIDEAKETVIDILTEGASSQDVLEALLELLIVATIMGMDVEHELEKILEKKSSIIAN